MAFRGYLAVNGVEIVNSSRVIAHLGRTTPADDTAFTGGVVESPYGSGLYTTIGLVETPAGSGLYDPGLVTESPVASGSGLYSLSDCSLTEVFPGLFAIPSDSYEVNGDGLWSPPNGSRRFGPGLMEVADCWGDAAMCRRCASIITYDDSWPGLQDFLGDMTYRVELAPWHVVEQPESAEFGGVWLMELTGLDSTPIERNLTPLVGPGSVSAPHRDVSRTLQFDAYLCACTNAGLEYGLKWLTCILRDTIDNTDSVLRYMAAHPGHSLADPQSLLREAHGLVLTKAPEVKEAYNPGHKQNQQAISYRVTWEMGTLSPYAYMPAMAVKADWSEIQTQPVNWIHHADCEKPETCVAMPVMFSEDCIPEEIEVIVTPPPVCGGCLPVGEIVKYRYRVPTMVEAFACRETVVTTIVRNLSGRPLTAQMFWRVCGADVRCEDNQFPLQVSGLPAGAELTLEGITGRYRVFYDERIRRPVGVVGTPTGAPWRPPLIDRHTCWDFIVQTDVAANFEVEFVLADREP